MKKLFMEFRAFHKGHLNIFTHITGFSLVFFGFFEINLIYILFGLFISEISHIYYHFLGKISYSKHILGIQSMILLGSITIYILLNYYQSI